MHLNIRKYINKLFGVSTITPEDPTISPTYAPYLADRIKTIGTTLEELWPDRDYTRLKALKTAYSTKHPKPEQLKTIHSGSQIIASLPTNILMQHDWRGNISLEDDLAKISDMAELAGDYLETEHGRVRFSSIEHAKHLAGYNHTDDHEDISYVDKVNNLSEELRGHIHIYPIRTTKKIEYAAQAICDMAEGHTPDGESLEGLIVLEACIHAINLLVNSLKLRDYPNIEGLDKAAKALIKHNNNYDDGPIAIINTVENLIINNAKHGPARKYDLEAEAIPEETLEAS